jgi:hypothetical protein
VDGQSNVHIVRFVGGGMAYRDPLVARLIVAWSRESPQLLRSAARRLPIPFPIIEAEFDLEPTPLRA